MKQTLKLRASQKLAMTPQLQQAIKLLQMSTIELVEEIQSAHEDNPLLEIRESDSVTELEDQTHAGPTPSGSLLYDGDDTPYEDLGEAGFSEWDLNGYESDAGYYYETSSSRQDSSDVRIEENILAHRSESLRDSLMSQAIFHFQDERDRRIARYLIQNISESGYLENSLIEIQQSIAIYQETSLSDIEKVLFQIQKFEPAGVAARTPSECLLIQLQREYSDHPDFQFAMEIIDNYIELLAVKDFSTLAEQIDVSQQQLQSAVNLIKRLNPYPGDAVAEIKADYIIPDVFVENKNGSWRVRANPAVLPNLTINQTYKKLILEKENKWSLEMKSQLQHARWLLDNIEKRSRTILSVARAIVERQQNFFDYGSIKMQPLKLAHISESLDIHESTVSRAVNGKYLSTPQGIFELKYFFSTGVGNDNNLVSATAIKSEIKSILAEESVKKPVSDEKIRELLASKDIEIARRTVTKYREQMNIPSSSKRKMVTTM